MVAGWDGAAGCRLGVVLLTVSICILSAQEPPPGLARKVAHRENETQAERNQYAYRQTVRLQELDSSGAMSGEYREVRDVISSPLTSEPSRWSARHFTLSSISS